MLKLRGPWTEAETQSFLGGTCVPLRLSCNGPAGHPLLRVLHDGDCPLCAREVRMLEKLDRGRARLQFEDIADLSFDASRYGLTHERVMARIHGVLPNGEIVEGLEVFRRAYDAVGLGWLWAPTRWPILRSVANAAYRVFARHRLRLTGRSSVACRTDSCRT